MPDTGTVCPRNSVQAPRVNAKVFEFHCNCLSHPAWKIWLADAVAKTIMPRLNVICDRLRLVFLRGQHCTAADTQVITTDSAALRFATATSKNGKFKDMLPLIPGSFTFIR